MTKQRKKGRALHTANDVTSLLARAISRWRRHSRELKYARFQDADGNRKWPVFPLNFSSHNHIYITKYLYSIRDDKYKNLRDTTVLAREMFSSGCRPLNAQGFMKRSGPSCAEVGKQFYSEKVSLQSTKWSPR